MISSLQAIILGAVQGVTELFPISSLGHSVILPQILGWNNINQNSDFFLIFLVMTHLATALVLFGFFFKDWVLIIKGIFRSLKMRKINSDDIHAKLGWLIIISSIPAGILGFLLQNKLKTLFASPQYAALFLICNGFLLYGAELLRRKKIQTAVASDKQITKISFTQGLKVGFAECLALIPGFSRTGSTLGGGLLVGLDHEAAARFSFLLATPIIFAAGVLELPKLIIHNNVHADTPVLLGVVAAGLAAYCSVSFLTKYFQTKKLTPFALYCIFVGLGASLLFLFR